MIRRDYHEADGSAQWLLVAQTEHARLSGVLAERWDSTAVEPLVARDELLPAVYHHDDGWSDWELRPEVDTQQGWPRSFTEMPQETALAIWQRSIDRVAQIGPLAAWTVSGHFLYLLEHALPSHAQGSEHQPAINAFVARQSLDRKHWLADWQRAHPLRHTLAAAELALAQLRFFDALSLWFCMRSREQAETFDLPGGGSMRVTPGSGERFAISPWPYTLDRLEISISGRLIPAARYRDTDALLQAADRSRTLTWQLEPDS